MIAPSSVSLAQAKPTKREACEIVTARESCDQTESMIAPREIVTARESRDQTESTIAPSGTFSADQSCGRAKG
jgi:hypothetical protein